MGSLLALKLGCLLALALAPLLCGLLPAALLRLRGPPEQGSFAWRAWALLSCAAAGVFLAACLLDMVPDSLADLREELRRRDLSPEFPLPELVLALGFLLVLVLEHVALDCAEQTPPDAAALPLLPCEEGRGGGAGAQEPPGPPPAPFRSLVLTLALSLHAAFEGLAVGLQDAAPRVLQLAAAILLHKAVVAASLGLLLLRSRLPACWLLASVAAFALMSPLGLGLGLALSPGEGGGGSGGAARGTLEGVAAGTFVYVTFLEILPQGLSAPAGRLPKVLALLLGFTALATLRLLG